MTAESVLDAADRERRAFFDQQAEWWDSVIEDYTQSVFFERWWELAAPRAGETIVEIGCGTGRLTALFRAAAAEMGGRFLAGDISSAMLERAARRDRWAFLAQLDVRAMPMRAGSVDAIVIPNTFPHLVPVERTLAECERVLRPAGRLEIVHFASRAHINGVHGGHGGVIGEDLIPPASLLARLLTEAGLGAVRAEDECDHYWVSAVKLPSSR